MKTYRVFYSVDSPQTKNPSWHTEIEADGRAEARRLFWMEIAPTHWRADSIAIESIDELDTNANH